MRRLTVPAVLALLAACSGASGPIVDTKGLDLAQYERDKAECEAYATQVSTGQAVAKGAAGGAAVGAAIGAIASGDAGRGAGIGAVTGGAESARIATNEKTTVVRNCLRGRGYHVLN
jgi:hypothetical protein